MVKFVLHFGFLVDRRRAAQRPGHALLLVRARRVPAAASPSMPSMASSNSASPRWARTSTQILIQPITSRQTGINVFGAVGGTQEVFRPNALTGDPNRLGIELVVPLLILTPMYLRLERGHRLKTPLAVLLAFLLVVDFATLSRSALLGLGCGCADPPAPYRRHLRTPGVPRAAGRGRDSTSPAWSLLRLDFFLTVLRAQDEHEPRGGVTALRGLLVRSGHPLDAPVPRARAEQLRRVLRVRHGPPRLRPALVLRCDDRGDRASSAWGFLRGVRRVAVPAARRGAQERGGCLREDETPSPHVSVRPPWGMTAALVATLVANVFYLTMTFYYFYVFATLAADAARDRSPSASRMKVVVLTTSYPRFPGEVAGAFVRDAVLHLRGGGGRGRGRVARVVHALGLAYGHGISGTSRAAPWKSLPPPCLPRVVRARGASSRAQGRSRACALASLRAARTCDAEAIRPSAVGDRRRACSARSPGPSSSSFAARDSCSARRRRSLRLRARSEPDEVRVASERSRPFRRRSPSQRSRLTPSSWAASPRRKASWTSWRRRTAVARVVVGDGPLRDRVPNAVGFVPPGELGAYYGRAAIVVCPSRREGYGVVAREAMAHRRPVVATFVGGLADAVEDGVTGRLVPARDPSALRDAIRVPCSTTPSSGAGSATGHASARASASPGRGRRKRPSARTATRSGADRSATRGDPGLAPSLDVVGGRDRSRGYIRRRWPRGASARSSRSSACRSGSRFSGSPSATPTSTRSGSTAALDQQLGYVLAAVGAFAGVYVLQSIRWRRIAATPAVGLPRFLEMTVSGVAVNNVLPGRIGDFLRARWLGLAARISAGKAFGTVVLDRVFDLVVLVGLLIVGIAAVALTVVRGACCGRDRAPARIRRRAPALADVHRSPRPPPATARARAPARP